MQTIACVSYCIKCLRSQAETSHLDASQYGNQTHDGAAPSRRLSELHRLWLESRETTPSMMTSYSSRPAMKSKKNWNTPLLDVTDPTTTLIAGFNPARTFTSRCARSMNQDHSLLGSTKPILLKQSRHSCLLASPREMNAVAVSLTSCSSMELPATLGRA